MSDVPKWFKIVAAVALLWNLLGCAAYLADVTLKPEDVAKMSPEQQELYAARPAWAVAATATAVWCGALGCLGLILRKRWSNVLLVLSLLGVLAQDAALFGMSNAIEVGGAAVVFLQGLVLVVAVGLVFLGRKAQAQGWLV
jgi:hypothetical protein